MRTTTLVLADDHQILRQGLRALLAAEADLQIVAETDNGLEAVRLVETLEPDVLVVDLMMPGLTGLDVTREVRARCPHTQVVILSMYAEEAYVLTALRHGAAAYVLKEASADDLVQAVRAAASGQRFLSARFAQQAIEAYVEKAKRMPADAYEALTARERAVLHLVVEGHTQAAIAARLGISRRTVESHRANMMRKLGLRTPADLLRYALSRGLTPPEGPAVQRAH